ncbi:hypothetical protein A3K69_04180 [Candidatus Bathyarchaeota archaeon RBG_16_57_9]|nr:MAG: hypothetical protein A3K69_04180 [Candidatus Bathyarchaeota archaeon RBG_16_57_9]OGD52361.1 MAG: hypothetical protein A3K81_04175 [Candidatus Bathyarchaeota archaeon RBG_13_60_20]
METEMVRSLARDSKWLTENYEKIQNSGNKVVVIKNEEVILETEDYEEMLALLEERNEDPAFLVIEVVPPKDAAFIL